MASHDAVSERGELELKVKFAGAAEGTEIEQTYSHCMHSYRTYIHAHIHALFDKAHWEMAAYADVDLLNYVK